jgi:hypothetical protein
MCGLPLNREDYKRLREEYDKADTLVAEVQAFVEMAGIPAINELRYAGYHLLNSLIPAQGDGTEQDHLTQAVNHCKRATYEASEMGILTAFGMIILFKSEYEQVIISNVIPDWHEILTKCDGHRDALSIARQTGQDRSKDHSNFKVAFADLVGVCRRLDHARNDLNRLIEQERTSARRHLVTTVIAVAGIVVAAVLGIFALVI